ncbi:MAG: ABC transporter ATP-binding protein, partial [Conchiformibius sp.]|nr:ABC transporter ATP-binding protein [Conchiformibius sp.]
GGYQDYLDAKSREQVLQQGKDKTAATDKPEQSAKPKNRAVKLSFKEQRELDALPERIAALEDEQNALNAQLSDPEVFKDYEAAALLQNRAEAIEMELLECLERWEWLEAKQAGSLKE